MEAACLSDGVLVANENGLAGAGLSEEVEVAAVGKLKPANGEGLSAAFAG